MKLLKNFLRFFLTGLLLALIVYKVGPGKILVSFKNIHPFYFILAILLAPIIVILKAYKWHLLAKTEEPTFSGSQTFKAFLLGLGLSIITPSRVGEIGRVFYLPKGDRLRLTGLVIIDKVFDFLVVAFLALAGTFYFLGLQTTLAILLAALFFIFLFFNPKIFLSLLKIAGGWVPFKDKIKNLVLSLELLNPRLTFNCLLITLVSFLVMTGQFYFFIRAFEPVNFKAAFLCYPLILLTNLIPLTIGNLGIREGSAAILLGQFGVASQSAVNAAFLLFLADTVVPGLIGALFLGKIRVKSPGKI